MMSEIAVERRMTVHGWKVEDGKRKEFTSTSTLFDDSSIRYEEARIGEVLPDWQPHITGVVVTERFVTPWRESYRTPSAQTADG
jgi:hypothetical protein